MKGFNLEEMERIGNVPGDFSSTVQYFDGRRVSWLGARCLPDLCDITSLLQHAEGSAEC
jgi:hypothetical protein